MEQINVSLRYVNNVNVKIKACMLSSNVNRLSRSELIRKHCDVFCVDVPDVFRSFLFLSPAVSFPAGIEREVSV